MIDVLIEDVPPIQANDIGREQGEDAVDKPSEDLAKQQLRQKEAKRKHVIYTFMYMSFFPSAICGLAATWMGGIIKRDIKKGIEEELDKLGPVLQRDLTRIEIALEKASLSHKTREECRAALEPASRAIAEFKYSRIVAQRISTWLLKEKNILKVRDDVLGTICQQQNIRADCRPLLRNDIANFLIWLGESLTLKQGYILARSRLTLLEAGHPNCFYIYKAVIHEIREYRYLKKLSYDSYIFRDFTDELERHVELAIQAFRTRS